LSAGIEHISTIDFDEWFSPEGIRTGRLACDFDEADGWLLSEFSFVDSVL